MDNLDIIELIIDEQVEDDGINAISLVESPAIEENFVALNKHKVEFKTINDEKKIIIGLALVPNKLIYRRKGDYEYNIVFSKETVRKASELYLKRLNNNNTTLEHKVATSGVSVIESWIVEDPEKDKSALYGLNAVEGAWVVTMKIDNDKVWEDVKEGKYLGLSIEGMFSDKEKVDNDDIENLSEQDADELIKDIIETLESEELKSYSDYPKAAKNNARRALDYKKKNGSSCGTSTGWTRASQLSSGSAISRSTIARMASFKRHQQHKDVPYSEGCGGLMWDAWGGSAGVNWAISKLKQIDSEKLQKEPIMVGEDYIIVDDRLAYKTKEKAEKISKDIGCGGYHIHEVNGQEWYMPCERHSLDMYNKCPKGYKKKGGKCTKMAEVGPKGGIKKSPKAPKSDTPNPSPKGKGSAKGDASGKTGAKVSEKDRASLQKKADDFNKRYKEKLGYGITVGMLASVFQRGLGAFNTSHSPNVKSASQWAHARVNAFMYLVKNGKPQNAKYTTDYDLLPAKHPKSSKK